MDKLVAKEITNAQAAELLGLSVRQIKRIKKEMQNSGIQAFGHGNAGRKPKHALDQSTVEQIIELAQTDLKGANCTHMAELMAEHFGISVSPRTVQRVLKRAGIAIASRKAPRQRRMRERKPQPGILVQCDASPHDWLEGRGPNIALHGLIDDATGAIVGLHFRPQEDIIGYFNVFRQMFETHGIPLFLYSDRHTMFFSPKKDKLSIEEELQGKQVNLTQIGRILDELDITHIPAYSPQAKGRIERLWGTLQSRLPIEMRLLGINTIEQANKFLLGYILRYNARFAVPPAEETLAFRPLTPDLDLDMILTIRESRKALGGSIVSYHNTKFQLHDENDRVVGLAKKDPVLLLTHLDGSISALYKGKHYSLVEFHSSPVIQASTPAATIESKPVKTPWKPPDDHPWKRPSYEHQQRIQQARNAAKGQNNKSAGFPLAVT